MGVDFIVQSINRAFPNVVHAAIEIKDGQFSIAPV
jgi:hypothetical protein